MAIRELYLTNSVVKNMLGLAPILAGVPEIKQALAAGPEMQEPKRKGCCGGGRRAHEIPVSSAKVLAPVIAALPESKKQIILETLGADLLKGFVGNSQRAINLAQRPA